MFDEVAVGVLVEDLTGRIVNLNPAAARLLGTRAPEAIGRRRDDLPALLTDDDTEHRSGDGGLERVFAVTRAPVADRRGRRLGVVTMLNDVTALRRVEHELREHTRELEAANGELDAFTHSVSHDLRAPLRSVAGFAEALRADCAATLDPTALRYLERVESAYEKCGR